MDDDFVAEDLSGMRDEFGDILQERADNRGIGDGFVRVRVFVVLVSIFK